MSSKKQVAKDTKHGGKAPKAKRKFTDADWDKIPSKGQLFALAIRAYEAGTPMVIQPTRQAAKEALGYATAEN
jgi:hypothetical protein